MAIPRNEYPRPQFVRDQWLCLNGPWQFEMDQGDSGLERGLKDKPLSGQILVPFCPESTLSGIGHTDFINAVWYRREVKIPKAWGGKRVLLHFQAVDYDATVWVNGQEVNRHRGGWTGFTCDLTGVVGAGDTATIVVRARDLRAMTGKPAGKQSNHRYDNAGCHYTRTTGIWQTVWMEPVPQVFLERPRITSSLASGSFRIIQPINGDRAGLRVRATLLNSNKAVCRAIGPADKQFCPELVLSIPADKQRLWSCEDPFLYDVLIELLDPKGKVMDSARSYAGLRSVTVEGKAVKINGRPLFQRLVLDQGYYPDGILTAPTERALVKDIELSLAAGFNGARLHQKVFEERFLYHADRLGYLCWGEFGDWGIDRQDPSATYVAQWLEAILRDYNHPCIVGWCGLNETRQEITDSITGLQDLTRAMFLAAKALDTTRPVLDASGYSHFVRETDIYDSHDYDQNPETFRARHAGTAEGRPYANAGGPNKDQPISWPYGGQPCFVSEFGGTWWNPAEARAADGRAKTSWGYGKRPATLKEFYDRFEKLTGVLLEDKAMFGYCYTQLTDVFQEQNGIYLFDRKPKFDMKRIRTAQQRVAAVERHGA